MQVSDRRMDAGRKSILGSAGIAVYDVAHKLVVFVPLASQTGRIYHTYCYFLPDPTLSTGSPFPIMVPRISCRRFSLWASVFDWYPVVAPNSPFLYRNPIKISHVTLSWTGRFSQLLTGTVHALILLHKLPLPLFTISASKKQPSAMNSPVPKIPIPTHA